MPFGVSKDFLNLTQQRQRHALVALAPLAVLGLLGGVVAELLDPPRFGSFVLLYGAAVAVGLVVGVVVGWWETRSWAESLREGWTEWMHSSVGAGTIPEAAARAGARRIQISRASVAVLVVLNGSCLAGAWYRLPPFAVTDPFGAFAMVTVLATGLAIGAKATLNFAEAWWCRQVESQTRELVESGKVGVWGYR